MINTVIRFLVPHFFIIHGFTSSRNDFIVDYFSHKRVPSIVKFTSDIEEDFSLMRDFSAANVKTVFSKKISSLEIYRLLKTDNHKLGVVLFFEGNWKTSLIFSQATRQKFFGELHCWLVIIPHMNNLSDLIDDSGFNLSTDFVIAVTLGYSNYLLYDVYNPFKDRGGRLNVTYLGSWNNVTGLNLTLKQSKYARRSNMHGMIWRVAYFSSKYRPKNVSLVNHLRRPGTKDGLPKFGYSIVNHLSEIYNATLELREYGSWKKGDKSGPLSRALEAEEIDMTGTLISMIPEKLSMVQFVYPTWPFRTCFMLRSPQPKNIKVDEIFRPFDRKVWIMFFGITGLIFIVMTMTFGILQIGNDFCLRFSNAFIITLGSICQQASCFDFIHLSTRVIFLVTMFFSLLVYNYYSALVVSARLNEPIIKLKDSLIRLAETGLHVASEPMIYFDFLMKDNGKEAEYFNSSKWQKVPETERFIFPEKGMDLVRRGQFAYHTHPDVGYPYINRFYSNREVCELTEVHLGRVTYRSIAIAYNSTYTKLFKLGFARISEVGIRHRQLLKWTSRKPRCRKDILSASSVTLEEFAPQLIMLLTGVIVAIIICCVEILFCSQQSDDRVSTIEETSTRRFTLISTLSLE